MSAHVPSLHTFIESTIGWERAGVRSVILAGALLCALLAGLAADRGIVRAQITNTFSTTTLVPPGGVITTTVTTPGVNITASSPINGCPTTGFGTPTVTYACTNLGFSLGVSPGASIAQTFSVPSGPISETVTYNANGPLAGFPAVSTQTVDNGTCAAPTSTIRAEFSPVIPVAFGISCSTQTSVSASPNGALQVWVTGGGSQDLLISSAPSTLGTCALTSSIPTQKTTFAVIIYTCALGQSVPAATNVSVGVQTSIPVAQLATQVFVNANAPLPATVAISSPTTQTLSFGAPTLATINPSSGPSGTVVTITGTNLGGTPTINFGTTPATNVTCNATGLSCTVTAPALAAGTTASVTAVNSAGTSNALSFSFTASATATGTTTTGTSGTGTTTTGTTASANSVTYALGWNIVGGPAGTVVTGTNGPLYTYQAGDTDYETVASGTPLTPGRGYWAYFNASTTDTIAAAGPQTLTVALPPGQWVMIGNAGSTTATVTGADIVYTYTAMAGYQPATNLGPGQGAWAISVGGGSATVRSS